MEAANLAGDSHLAGEPAAEVRVARVMRVHHLDRDFAPARRLAQEHPAHSTRTETAQQPERADLTGIADLQLIHPPTPASP
jgi:hypothetical protein